MSQINDLEISYGKVTVVKKVSFEAKGGSILSIIGPNGPGKSSLLKGILSLVIPSAGSISFTRNPSEPVRIGYMPQSPSFPRNLKVSELILFLNKLEQIDQDSFNELFSMLELEQHMDKKFGSLSGGTKQKVSILQCFSVRKPIYIIDEPTASLDPYISNLLKNIILKRKSQGGLVIFSTHILSEVQEIADRFILMSEGSVLIDDTPLNFLAKNQTSDLQSALMDFWNREYIHKK